MCVCILALPALHADEFQLKDGDRVVLIGNTLIEREQRYAYWESALIRRYPRSNVTFRNLGWSGDTVFGDARASFGTAADGYRRLKEHVIALKPTVLFVAYGTNESFQGEAGLPRFVEGLTKLLDELAATKARVVLVAPQKQEDLGRPLPDPTANNHNLHLYGDALRDLAKKRGYAFVDLYELLADAGKAGPLTDNGIHFTAYGYWRSASAVQHGLGLKAPRWRVEIKDGKATTEGATVANLQTGPLRFETTDAELPIPPAPKDAPAKATLLGVERVLLVRGLPEGKHTLHIDGKAIVTATAAEWAAGVTLNAGPEFDQTEQLRGAVIEKNHLYFHRWRPQNETYLFGFRKHEQGQNAKEVPEFDPLVEKQEEVIAKLRVPVMHRYQLIPEKK
jgi:lysophospholipase L1-like esterase